MTDFVVGFMREALSDRVLLLRKVKPAWQAGLLNGPGGKVERGESPIEAMVREWSEECGWETKERDWRLIASMTDFQDIHAGGGTVYWFATECRFFGRESGASDHPGETLCPVPIRTLPERSDVVASVPWMVLLAFRDVTAPFVQGVRHGPVDGGTGLGFASSIAGTNIPFEASIAAIPGQLLRPSHER